MTGEMVVFLTEWIQQPFVAVSVYNNNFISFVKRGAAVSEGDEGLLGQAQFPWSEESSVIGRPMFK